ncbi:MAG: sigma-70 family RNA polymerase sigma factor [Actinomycetota bacterium]|nr:sigma-70 family RNA polymerase sigma factor [Actinomycetota bacterium]
MLTSRDTGAPVVERTNEQWLAALRGSQRDEALADLRAVLVRGLRPALKPRAGGDPEASIEDFAQEALVKILNNLDSFRGESRFTTWAQKIAVRAALAELRRRRWRDVSLQELVAGHEGSGTGTRLDTLADPRPTPEQSTTQKMMLSMVERLIEEELTERQREAMVAVMMNGMPLEEAARRMETNRNALYKLSHDARKRLKKRLAAEGLSPQEVLAAFSEE